jgi:aminoglycoside 3-N-acetyltransferase
MSDKTRDNPLMLHINPIGLLRMGKCNTSRFFNLHTVLNKIQKNGGCVAVPSYSYTYTKNKIYEVLNTPSELDSASEYLRKKNTKKRTTDANFSYLLFGDSFSKKYFKTSNYSSFGEGSLIEEVFNKDGYLGAIGNALEYLTEIHFLEKKLNVDYRFDKVFTGYSIDSDGNKMSNKITYFCRDLNANYSVSLVQLKKDIKSAGLIETWRLIEFNLKIEVIKIRELYLFIKEKLLIDPEYLWEK